MRFINKHLEYEEVPECQNNKVPAFLTNFVTTESALK